jgi:hypothetical protein
VQQQPGDFEERALLGEIGDVVAPVAEDAFFAVDERDGASAGARVAKAGIQRDEARRGPQLLDVTADSASLPVTTGIVIDLPL